MGVVADGTGEDPLVCTSVRLRVRANSPFNVGPQCATVLASKNPGEASTLSPALRILIELRSGGEGFVVDLPLIWSAAFAPWGSGRSKPNSSTTTPPAPPRCNGPRHDELVLAFEQIELNLHRRGEVSARTLPTRGRPALLQHLITRRRRGRGLRARLATCQTDHTWWPASPLPSAVAEHHRFAGIPT